MVLMGVGYTAGFSLYDTDVSPCLIKPRAPLAYPSIVSRLQLTSYANRLRQYLDYAIPVII